MPPPPPGPPPPNAPSPISGTAAAGGSVPANSVTSGASPASVAESSEGSYSTSGLGSKDLELQRKRARDRKSQQAMRDRTKWTIANLSEQVAFLSQIIDERTRDLGLLDTRVRMLETENAHLRTQNAALQLSLLGSDGQAAAPGLTPGAVPGPSTVPVAGGSTILPTGQSPPARPKMPWELPPVNSPPSCISDQILQGFLRAKIERRTFMVPGQAPEAALAYSPKPNLGSLLDRERAANDDISNVTGDIIRSYLEIDTLPKQVAVFYIMQSLLKWMVLMDKNSWEFLPSWLRPIPAQLSNLHAAWIDRIPWPQVRRYLILDHPEITLDDFAATYSSSFTISWPYEPSHVLLVTQNGPGGVEETTVNPVYEEHIRQLKNWNVGKSFREQWPEIAILIDESHSQA